MIHRRTIHQARRGRRGFTLLELVLAMSLGAIVAIAAWAIFGMLSRTDRIQVQRLDRAQELSFARHAMMRAFTTLLMSEDALPTDEQLKERIDADIKSAEEEPDLAVRGYSEARFAIQPEQGFALGDGEPGQIVCVTVRTPPVIGGMQESSRLGDELGLSADQMEMLRRAGPAERQASSTNGPSSRLLLGLLRNEELDPEAIRLLTQSVRIDEETRGVSEPTPQGLLPARAPGVRGRFELRHPRAAMTEDEQNRARVNAQNFGQEAESFELWWVQLPPGAAPAEDLEDNSLANEERTDGDDPQRLRDGEGETAPANEADGGSLAERLANARQAAAPEREIRLIGGLTSAKWRVYRQKKFLPKIVADFDRELPAYVEFSFTTTDGRDERWAFEVAWVNGAEPGTITEAPGVAAQFANGNEALGPDGRPIPPVLDANGKPVANADGSGGGANGAGSNKPGGGGGREITPSNANRDQVMQMVNERLNQLRGGN